MNIAIYIVGGLIVGGVIGYVVRTAFLKGEEKRLAEKSKQILKDAESKAEKSVLSARQEAMKLEENAKREERKKMGELRKTETRLLEKEKDLNKKMDTNEKRKDDLEEKLEKAKKLKGEAEEMFAQQKGQLEKIAALSKDEAKEILFKKVEDEFKPELIEYAKKLEAEAKEEAEGRAREIIGDAIQKYSGDVTAETTSTTITLPSDDMKGRIIGREGRNINAFEEATGIDVIVDDTPGSIVISGFDMVRRYIAKVALEKLIADGRIHPARIEETVRKVKNEVSTLIRELGEQAAFDTSVTGLAPDLLKVLGRLKFRISHGQNVLKHSMEVSHLAGAMAATLGAKVDVCKKAGLLHAVGKAVDHEVPGKYSQIGRDILKKYGLPEAVIHCVEAVEGDVDAKTVEAMILGASNKIANARPGARKDNLDNFIKRLNEVENLANDIKGVEKSYAVQAGREIRVFVNPEEVDDLQAIKLSHEIARRIEKEMQHAGQVKVEVIREKRAEGFAT